MLSDYLCPDFPVHVTVTSGIIDVWDLTDITPALIGSYEGEDLFMDCAYMDCCDWFVS